MYAAPSAAAVMLTERAGSRVASSLSTSELADGARILRGVSVSGAMPCCSDC